MNEKIGIRTVAGRQELIAKVEDINAGLHQLDLHLINVEKDMARLEAENKELRRLLSSKHNHELDLEQIAISEQLVRAVWRDGMSVYDPAVQTLVDKLEL